MRAARHRNRGGAFPHHGGPNSPFGGDAPDNRIAVACSEGSNSDNNKVQVYDIARPNLVLFQSELGSAHGVVWNETTQRLYAIGGQSLQIYKLKDWTSATPSLELEKTVQTPYGGLHDMSLVNSNTLCIGGRRAYLYDIGANQFTEMTLFASSTAIKSINYNDDTANCGTPIRRFRRVRKPGRHRPSAMPPTETAPPRRARSKSPTWTCTRSAS